jgi:hypothetical protein
MVYMLGFPAHIDTVGQRMYCRFSVELLGTFLILHGRQFQCLPERTAAVAIYTLIGAEPIETTLDKNAMILFTISLKL